MKRIILECPQCKAKRYQKIPESLMEQRNQFSDKGVVAVLIPENTLCEHGFMVFIDRNFSIRDVKSLEKIQEMNKMTFVHLKTIEDLLGKLNPTALQSIIQKL